MILIFSSQPLLYNTVYFVMGGQNPSEFHSRGRFHSLLRRQLSPSRQRANVVNDRIHRPLAKLGNELGWTRKVSLKSN